MCRGIRLWRRFVEKRREGEEREKGEEGRKEGREGGGTNSKRERGDNE